MDPATKPTRARRRWRFVAAPAALLVLAVGLALALTRAEDTAAPAVTTTTTTTATTTTTTPTTTTTTIPPDPVPPVSTVTATPKGTIARYDSPGGSMVGTVDNHYYGNPTALPVVEEAADGWLRVRTPYRPNGSTTWIRSSDAVLGSTPWAIQIDVTTTHLRLYDAGQKVLDAPVGVGMDATPTALGDFFMTHFQAPSSSAYGPFVMITSGHSEVLQSFGGFPDGIFAIHGPISPESWIGDSGSRISNGCIRMKVADQVKLAVVTTGSPIHVYASPSPALALAPA